MRHTDGEAMIQEILDLGFDRIELGYDLRQDLVPGVRKAAEEMPGLIESLHNFCPVPLGVPRGHPELWTLADPDPRARRNAIEYTSRTIRFAAELGANVVVMHSGNIKMRRYTPRLVALHENGKQFSKRYEKTKMKMQIVREKKGGKQLDYLYEGLERLLPVLSEYNIRLGIENLPTWEAVPTEIELEKLLNHFDSTHLGYWHDMGHAQVRQNLGLINHLRWLERLQHRLLGMHIHDVAPPFYDHLMPPKGEIDFTPLKNFGNLPVLRVFEPSPREPREDVERALKLVREAWKAEPTKT